MRGGVGGNFGKDCPKKKGGGGLVGREQRGSQ